MVQEEALHRAWPNPPIIIASVSAGSSTDTSDNDDQPAAEQPADEPSRDEEPADEPAEDDCTNTATGDCTPEVEADRAVRVDALTWSIEDTTTTTELGDAEFGLGETADDVFLVVTLKVKSNKDESATLSNDSVKLESADGNSYADSEGTIAAIGAGEDPLFFEDIGPDQTTTSKVVFDVPQSVLDGGAKLRFNELGLGSTHGFIKLPAT